MVDEPEKMGPPRHLLYHANLYHEPSSNRNKCRLRLKTKTERNSPDGHGQIMIEIREEPDCWMFVHRRPNRQMNRWSRQGSANGEG